MAPMDRRMRLATIATSSARSRRAPPTARTAAFTLELVDPPKTNRFARVRRANPAPDKPRASGARRGNLSAIEASDVGGGVARRRRREKRHEREHSLPLDLGRSRVGKVSRRAGQTSTRTWAQVPAPWKIAFRFGMRCAAVATSRCRAVMARATAYHASFDDLFLRASLPPPSQRSVSGG